MIPHDRSILILAVIALLAGDPPAQADDVQVNTYTNNNQMAPAVAMDMEGDFVIVWRSDGSAGTDVGGNSIQSQRYIAGGATSGGELQVNFYTTSQQISPSVAMAPDGDFAVVWVSYGSSGTDTSESSIQGQRYASSGSVAGGEFQVNVFTDEYQLAPSVAMAADGDFVVVWSSEGSGGSDMSTYSIQGRRYASDGSLVGGEFQVNTYTTGGQEFPSVAMDVDGDFVVVWESPGAGPADPVGSSIRGRRFASNGSTLGTEFQVNTASLGDQKSPTVAIDAAGDFVVVWSSDLSNGTDASGRSIQGQRYASDGSAVGGEFQVNTYTTGDQSSPSVAMAADGDFAVVWDSSESSGPDTDSSIQGQRYASDGATIGDEFQVNTYTTGLQARPSVALQAGIGFVVVWQGYGSSGTDTSLRSIQKSDAAPVPVELMSFRVE